MGGIMHAAGSVAYDKRPERAILSGLFLSGDSLDDNYSDRTGEPGIL
jgi:hypothetical protein